MTLVVDASVLAAIALDERLGSIAQDVVAGEAVIAPDLVLAELANVVWKNVRRKRLPRREAPDVLESALDLIDRLHTLASLQDAAFGLALLRDHPAYDCYYVALAQREGAPLVTADARLARVFAGDAEIRLLYPSASA